MSETTALVPAEQGSREIAPMQANVQLEDMKRPLLKVIQAISPEVNDLGVAAGQFFATVLNAELGKEITVTVLGHKKEFILWNPQRGVEPLILARSSDGATWDDDGANKEFNVVIPNVGKVKWLTKGSVAESGLHLFGSSVASNKDSKPALAETHNFLLHIHDEDMLPVAISLSRSKMDAARSLLTICFGSSADPRSLKVKIRIVPKQKDGQDYFNVVPMRAGKNDEETYYRMVDLSKRFERFSTDADTDENRGGSARANVDTSTVEY